MTEEREPETENGEIEEGCDVFSHEWTDHYYGYECAKCGMFVPFGSEPWMPLDDYEEDEYDYD